MKYFSYCFIIAAFFISSVKAQVGLLEPNESTAKQDSIIDVGIKLHDEGKYDEAITKYQSVLRENSSNITALYELSYSLFAKGDYDGVIQYSREGLKYNSNYVALFYLNIANAYDNQGKSEEAINTYRLGIELNPDQYLLSYNLGLAFYRINSLDSARTYLQQALVLNPSHPSSNLVLSYTYDKMGKNVPRLFAICRFLTLEPNSKRSKDALDQLQDVLNKFVTVSSSNPQEYNISIAQDSDEVDGDLSMLDMTMGIIQATKSTDAGKGKSDAQWTTYIFQSLFQIILETTEKDPATGFCWEYYVPYFAEMQKNGLTEAFTYFISTSSESEEVISWLNTHRDKIKTFIEWNKSYWRQ